MSRILGASANRSAWSILGCAVVMTASLLMTPQSQAVELLVEATRLVGIVSAKAESAQFPSADCRSSRHPVRRSATGAAARSSSHHQTVSRL